MIESTRGGPKSVEFVENPTAFSLIAVSASGWWLRPQSPRSSSRSGVPPLDAPMFRSDRLSGDSHTAARASVGGG
jgi:hypothetical protein